MTRAAAWGSRDPEALVTLLVTVLDAHEVVAGLTEAAENGLAHRSALLSLARGLRLGRDVPGFPPGPRGAAMAEALAETYEQRSARWAALARTLDAGLSAATLGDELDRELRAADDAADCRETARLADERRRPEPDDDEPDDDEPDDADDDDEPADPIEWDLDGVPPDDASGEPPMRS